MIRILQFGLSSSLGGIETYLKKVYDNIDKEKFKLDFLVMEDNKPCWYDDFLAEGSNFYNVTQRSKNPVKNRNDLIKLFKNEKFDIVHCHMNSLSNLLPITIALKYNNTVIVHSRNANTPDSIKTRLLNFINSKLLPKKKIIKVSVSRKAGEWMFGERDNFAVINNGIDIKRFKFDRISRNKIRKELGIENRFCITHIGAFRYQKNHKFLLEIFKDVLQQNANTILLLIGQGSLKDEVKSFAKELGVNDKIFMVGNRSDIPSILSASDAFLFPSFYEGFPNAVLEAQTSGLPCLISDTITSEVIINDNCMNMSLERSSSEWADELLSLPLSEDREVYSKEVWEKGFSVHEEIKKLEQFYFDCLK